MDKLGEILAFKREEVARRKLIGLPDRDSTPPRGFRDALHSVTGFGLIAEIKRASPSKGLIRADFDPAAHARAYEAGGAACLSVLTDERYFQGHDDFLVAARAATALPCLRKDFMVDPRQVAESRALGADAILIIVAALDDGAMREMEAAALDLAMDVLVEIHDEHELERALALKSKLIGINNRDLKTFDTDPARAWSLAARIPHGYTIVSESGIATHADLERAAEHGVRCFLVGEALMRQPDLVTATRELLAGRGPTSNSRLA